MKKLMLMALIAALPLGQAQAGATAVAHDQHRVAASEIALYPIPRPIPWPYPGPTVPRPYPWPYPVDIIM